MIFDQDHIGITSESMDEHLERVTQKIQDLLNSTDIETILVAIDGRCASGKTTLGSYLKSIFDCNLFHMDDFFLQPHQRSKQRLEEVGGNVDYERFYKEVVLPLKNKEKIQYQPFNCSTQKIESVQMILPKRLNIMEGAYSCHPYFGDIYSLRIFMDIESSLQRDRIRKRNGEVMLQRFINEWIPKENAYFEKFRIQEICSRI